MQEQTARGHGLFFASENNPTGGKTNGKGF